MLLSLHVYFCLCLYVFVYAIVCPLFLHTYSLSPLIITTPTSHRPFQYP
jgi:hypothetical protein